MDFRFSEQQEKFRAEVQEFLGREMPPREFPEDGWTTHSAEFSRKLAKKGWIGLTWPKEYGGQGRSYLDRLIFAEELMRYGAPVAAHWMADRQTGPALIAYGSEEQKKTFLPKMIKAEILFCGCLSEPGAGSDLASVQTKALEDGDSFVVNGQKVWTSWASSADFCWLLAVTDVHAPKYRGLSEFIVDMRLPGISVHPLTDMSGGTDLHEVFFDNVRIPREALVGQKNGAWYQMMSQMDYERSGIERLMANYTLFRDIKIYAREKGLTSDALIRNKLAELEIEFEVGRLLVYQVAWILDQGRLPNYESALSKAYCTAFEQRVADTATRILGPEGQLAAGSKWAPLEGRAVRNYLHSPAYTLQGGTSEVLMNIVAVRGLGLPIAKTK